MSTVSDLLTVRIGGERTAEAHKKPKSARATNNRIKSTKYTIFTFLPQNLLEQFRRIANFYFLVMVIISASIGKCELVTKRRRPIAVVSIMHAQRSPKSEISISLVYRITAQTNETV